MRNSTFNWIYDEFDKDVMDANNILNTRFLTLNDKYFENKMSTVVLNFKLLLRQIHVDDSNYHIDKSQANTNYFYN